MGSIWIQLCIPYQVFPQQLLISLGKSLSKRIIGFRNKNKRNMKKTFFIWEKKFSIRYRATSLSQGQLCLHIEFQGYSYNLKKDSMKISRREDLPHDPCSEFTTKMSMTKTTNYSLFEKETQMTTMTLWNLQENN